MMYVEIHVTAGPAKGQHFVFTKPKWFLVGRDADAEISLPDDPYVSRRHFLLKLFPSECLLRDLNSTNGVIVNGIQYGGKNKQGAEKEQAPPEATEIDLKNGDEIVLGDTRITILIDPSIQNPPADTTPTADRKKAAFSGEQSETIPSETIYWQDKGSNPDTM